MGCTGKSPKLIRCVLGPKSHQLEFPRDKPLCARPANMTVAQLIMLSLYDGKMRGTGI